MAGRLQVDSAAQVGENSFNAGFQNKAIGNYSQALGYQSIAKGEYATAIGREAIADKDNAYAFGNSAQAQGAGSYSFGAGAIATGTSSFAFGSEGQDSTDSNNPNTYVEPAKATGHFAYAFGSGAVAEGVGSLAMGINAKAVGFYSTAIGYKALAQGHDSKAFGWETTASGKMSLAMGTHTTAHSYQETAIGYYNTDYTPERVDLFAPNDRLFVIGNGHYPGRPARSDALIIYKNGNAEFRGDVYPSTARNLYTDKTTYTLGTSNNKWSAVYANDLYGTLQTSSDIRYKTDIKSLERALDKVLTLSGVTYKWRVSEFPEQHFDSKTHIGVIAQEVEKVFPELVNTDENGYKSVKYANIAPVLIEAIKELKAEKDALEAKLDKQEKEMAEMKKMLEELMKKQ